VWVVDQVAELLLEEREALPVGEGVAVDVEGRGDGVGGLAGDEKTGGAELVGGEGTEAVGRGWRMEDGGGRGGSWVCFARRRFVGRVGVGWGALAGESCGVHC
jgi:hypothetical protein